MPEDDRRPVRLLGVPLHDLMVLQSYFDDMVRELQLMAVGRAGKGAGVRLRDLAIYTQHEIARARGDLHEQASAADDAGLTHADLAVGIRPSGVDGARVLIDVLAALDAESRSGRMLTGPADPVVFELLRWIVAEVEAQVVDGREPQPFLAGGNR